MALMDFFSKNTKNSPEPTAAPAQPATNIADARQQQQPQTLTTQNDSATGPNGVVPAGSGESPLDSFKDLWQPNKDVEGKPILATSLTDKYVNVDPAKVREAATRVDFRKVVTPEQMQAAMAGGEAGVAAMMEAMNNMAQTVYSQSALTTSAIVEQALGQATSRFSDEIPRAIKQQNVRENLRAENPLFSNPAAEPMLKMIESQMTAKYPNATAAEISQSAKNYLEQFASALLPNKGKEVAAVSPSEDWDKFFGSAN